ncbi:hypothetical protein M409DRAFT_64404 [Zasmidium cellare ATCC 36951]|uniref:Uncharacterized protein n=1 Tax=Zasmidium cellare ATCC 36951 TaxID=1080233 RepID=A0A6A6CSF2_ZASCE|nr:uncharacterized protein M409DRAFT_64404 [Zasmidium cellare ATCC 36951]KAF2170021.1 hypothetical protein M409DRAFT_64404 [Zasmidium cellare ATCC 36951]
MATGPVEVEASCAICGAPPFPECPHEGQRLELALNQAMERWEGYQRIRDWILNHARNQIITTFHALRSMRMEAHRNYLQTLPYYTLYHRYNGRPPLQPAQLQLIHSQIEQANTILQQGVDQDWRTSCLRYPEVLDYYFGLVEFGLPSDKAPAIREPRFGAPAKEGARKAVKERRESVDMGVKEQGRKARRRSRSRGGGGRTPPLPTVPMPGHYRRS